MADTTITGLGAIIAGDFDDTAVIPVDDKAAVTKKATIAQLWTALASVARTFAAGITATSFSGPILQSGSAANLLLKYNVTTKVTVGTDKVTFVDGMVYRSRVVTGTDSVVATDVLVVCNSVGAFTLTLPTAVTGQWFNIKNIGAGTVTVDGASSDTIDGETTQLLYQWDGIVIQCQAANTWVVV